MKRMKTASTSTSAFPIPETDSEKKRWMRSNMIPRSSIIRHHVGISNIKRRLALMYGERASITCSNMDENYGAVVEVRLPKTE